VGGQQWQTNKNACLLRVCPGIVILLELEPRFGFGLVFAGVSPPTPVD